MEGIPIAEINGPKCFNRETQKATLSSPREALALTGIYQLLSLISITVFDALTWSKGSSLDQKDNNSFEQVFFILFMSLSITVLFASLLTFGLTLVQIAIPAVDFIGLQVILNLCLGFTLFCQKCFILKLTPQNESLQVERQFLFLVDCSIIFSFVVAVALLSAKLLHIVAPIHSAL
ncbi:uncharacterized protein LOC134844858 [Symsagittifera roscoffensis]|uniref:uncharacterized protein LOC134844858 n=1 Tax=Symsagittifera roscoffensis TaxID=84072 RepID=UPI00307C831E